MRNIALVHLELNLFISRKSGVSQALLLRNVDKFRTYPSPFLVDRWPFLRRIISLKETGQITVFENVLCFYAL